MEATEESNPVKKKKTWRIVVLIVILGLAVNLILPRMLDINEAVNVIRDMTWWLVIAAIVSEVLVYFSYGSSLKAVLDIQGHNLTVLECTAIFISSYSIGIVAGGWIGAAATTFGLFARRGVRKSNAAVAGLLPSMLANIPLTLIAVAGIVTLRFTGHLSGSQLIQYSIFIALLLSFSFGYLLALVFPKAAFNVVNWALWNWNRFRNKPYDPEATQVRLNILINAWRQMGNGNWLRPLLGTIGYYGFDLLAMYLVFRAAGYNISAGVLFAGYGLPLLLAKMAFIVPGGLGVIETSMAALFTSLGVPADVAVVVILGYRLISFWIPVMIGFLVYFLINRKQHKDERVEGDS
ncbi:MAG: lysylphosphatidylglycerol synthase transmembrane domain-containing protein [Anaerolineaceae bacterium]|nr:lysylphosphatidylglycerol synthase transmembrane domain-containing protein [Anaerolineaceae bacterium]MDD4043120.1 lysylphosphatidylglycerol synthase transmembrane domain-containing protein [Anaerolineaceae bacterium]MDD4578244.1 lysylphosphatidylglycerol synthase transmembrane domain-containing protein [Anaerolineaceae bacterium]